jgi:hypothetical protein
MNYKKKKYLQHKTIKKIKIGKRFYFPNFSCFVFKTDFKQNDSYLVVSDDGISNFINDDGVTYLCVDGVKEKIVDISSSIKGDIANKLSFKH